MNVVDTIKNAAFASAIQAALKYMDKDPETNIPKVMSIVDKAAPEGWYAGQRNAIRQGIAEKGNWYELATKVWELGHPAPENIMQQVLRWASLGREPFEERIGTCSWQLALAIPAAAVFNHSVKDFSGLHMRANFYKCGDLLQTPHFLSWNPIQLPKPCFHCPEFFGNIHFGE